MLKEKAKLDTMLNLLLTLGKQFMNHDLLHNVKVSADVKILPNKSPLPAPCDRSWHFDLRS